MLLIPKCECLSVSSDPTVFHLTHPKAGSQWIREMLKYAAPNRFVGQRVRET